MSECFVKINESFTNKDLRLIKIIISDKNCIVCGKKMTMSGYISRSFFYLCDATVFCSKKCMKMGK